MKEGLKLLRPECIFERNRKNKGNSMKNEFWNEGIDSGKNPENNSKFDVIVVGGGPIGSAVATYSAMQGDRVLLLEKESYPRDKTCGDAVGGKSLKHVEALGIKTDLENSPHYRITGVLFTAPNENSLRVERPVIDGKQELAGYVLPRAQFDWLMFNRATEVVLQNEGAVIQNFNVKEIIYDDGKGGDDPGPGSGDKRRIIGVKGKTKEGDGTYYGSVTIGAGGVRCPVSTSIVEETYQKTMVDNKKEHYSAAYRQYWKGIKGLNHKEGLIEFHYIKGVIPGYFWIFPLSEDTANVGFGIVLNELSKHEKKLKGLQDYIINEKMPERFKDAELMEGSSKGWQLPLGSPRKGEGLQPRRLFANGAMVVGDAGSLVDPFSGEGIANGFLSAKMAMDHFNREEHSAGFPLEEGKKYQKDLWDTLGHELTNSYNIQRLMSWPFSKGWLINMIINKARNKPELQRVLSDCLVSPEAQKKITSMKFLARQLLWPF